MSGNEFIDKFIKETQKKGSKKQLEWISYNKFKDIEYLDKGGFSIIYKAIWLDNNKAVVLKSINNFNNSSKNLNEFLNEVNIYLLTLIYNLITNCYLFLVEI